jgi:sugar phosphate isomerase/epimerase
MKGPALCLPQFLRDEPPFQQLESISKWAADLGFRGVQIPSWDRRVFDLDTAAASKSYCDDLRGALAAVGVAPTELAAHLQGQVLAVHPAYEELFQAFYPSGLRGAERSAWATEQLIKAVRASANMGTDNVPVLSGGFAWHLCYPWPQRPAGLIEEAFRELARLWKPVLDAAADAGVVFTYELHPGSDLYDGATYERFLEAVDDHAAACLNYDPSHFLLQQLDYLDFIRLYGDRIRAFHVKDAEFVPSGRMGVYSGYQSWAGRAGRFRSVGDGEVDFRRIFSLLTEVGFDGWAVLEWECCVKSPEQGAREGAEFIQAHLIETTDVAFDDFAGAETDLQRNRRILGLSE